MLFNLMGLFELLVRRNSIGGAGARAFAKLLQVNKTITQINLMSNNLDAASGKAIAKALETNRTITTAFLGIGANPKGKCFLEFTSGRALKCYGTSADFVLALVPGLVQRNEISLANVEWNDLGPGGTDVLAKVLASNESLTNLDLAWNSLGPGGGMAVAKMLETNQCIAAINLGNNSLDGESVAAIAHAIAVNTTVVIMDLIDLQCNDLGDEAKAVIVDAWGNRSDDLYL